MTKSLRRLKKRIDSYFDKNELHVIMSTSRHTSIGQLISLEHDSVKVGETTIRRLKSRGGIITVHHVDNFKKGIEYRTAPIPSGNVGIYTWPGSNTVSDWIDILPFEYLDDIVTDFIDEDGVYCVLVKTELGTLLYKSQINQRNRLRDFLMEIEAGLPWTKQASLDGSVTLTRGAQSDPFKI